MSALPVIWVPMRLLTVTKAMKKANTASTVTIATPRMIFLVNEPWPISAT